MRRSLRSTPVIAALAACFAACLAACYTAQLRMSGPERSHDRPPDLGSTTHDQYALDSTWIGPAQTDVTAGK